MAERDPKLEAIRGTMQLHRLRMQVGVRHLSDVLRPVLSGRATSLSDENLLLASYINQTLRLDEVFAFPQEASIQLEETLYEREEMDNLLKRWEQLEDVIDRLFDETGDDAEPAQGAIEP